MTTKVAAPARATRAPGMVSLLRAVYIIWYRDLLRYWRDRARLLGSLAQPLLFLVVFGTGLSSALGSGIGADGGTGGLTYLDYMFPGIIGMTILFSAIFGAMSIVWDREFGFLKEVLVAPVDRSAVAIGKALGSATQAMIQGLIILMLAPLVGVGLTVTTVLLLLPLSFILAFALASFGVAIASRLRSMQAFQVIMNFLLMPLFFLSGALFPLTGLPEWMTVLTRINPVTYGIDPIRRVVLEGAGTPEPVVDALSVTLFGQIVPIWVEVGILTVFGLAFLGLAVRNFRVRD